MAITLEPITAANHRDVLRLKVAPGQERFVAPNAVSLVQAAFSTRAWPRAIAADGVLVGFAMLELEQDGGVYLWRMMIGAEHQRRGHGTAALDRIVEAAGALQASGLSTSAVPGEGSPLPFYLRYGFVDTGRIEEGEHVLELPIEGGDVSAHEVAARRLDRVAEELDAAAAHARTAARHLRARAVPRSSAHVHALDGHLVRARRVLDEHAAEHADRAVP